MKSFKNDGTFVTKFSPFHGCCCLHQNGHHSSDDDAAITLVMTIITMKNFFVQLNFA